MDEVEKKLTSMPDVTGAAARAVERFVDEAGKSVEIAFSSMDSPVGELLLAATPAGLVRIGFDHETGVLDGLAERLSPRILEYPRRLRQARRELEQYFAGKRERFTVPIDEALIDGFRTRVLAATSQVPYGTVVTYREIATRAGRPNGARAAGRALGGNPIPVVIPCHRVLRRSGVQIPAADDERAAASHIDGYQHGMRQLPAHDGGSDVLLRP